MLSLFWYLKVKSDSVFLRFKQREDRRQRYIAEASGGKGREDFGLPGTGNPQDYVAVG